MIEQPHDPLLRTASPLDSDLQRSVSLRLLGGLALATTLIVSAAADPLPDSALAAVYSACAAGPAPAKARIETLSQAGWVIASDTPVRRDLVALGMVTRTMVLTDPLERLLSAFLNARERGLPHQTFPEGSDPDAEAILSSPYDLDRGVEFDLPDVAVILSVSLTIQSRVKQEYVLRCTLLLPESVPATDLESMIPAGIEPTAVKELEVPKALLRRRISYKDGSGQAGMLTHMDLTGFPNFAALPAKAGTITGLSTILEFTTAPVTLR
jgi:hypothetical protein